MNKFASTVEKPADRTHFTVEKLKGSDPQTNYFKEIKKDILYDDHVDIAAVHYKPKIEIDTQVLRQKRLKGPTARS